MTLFKESLHFCAEGGAFDFEVGRRRCHGWCSGAAGLAGSLLTSPRGSENGVNVSSEEVPGLPSALSVQPQPPQQRSLFVYVVVLLQY